MICYRCVPLFAMVVPLLALGLAAPAWAQADSDEPPERSGSRIRRKRTRPKTWRGRA